MQKSYLMTLYEIAEKDPRVLLLLADSGTSYDVLFKKYLPNQVLDFGIAEENMVASAAGMASIGKIPFVFTASAFLSYRSFEFIRDDVCFQNHNVKFVGMGEGLSWSTLGPTHHTTEEVALLRALPNLVVLSPSSPSMVEECIRFAYKHNGPVYIRIGMGGEKELYQENPKNVLENHTLKEGKDVAIFVTGAIASVALEVADKLNELGVSAKVVDVCALKPLDEKSIIKVIKAIPKIVSLEEHNIIGGLGSALADVIAKEGLQTSLFKIGLGDSFAVGYGTHSEVRKQNKLDSDSVCVKISDWLKGGK